MVLFVVAGVVVNWLMMPTFWFLYASLHEDMNEWMMYVHLMYFYICLLYYIGRNEPLLVYTLLLLLTVYVCIYEYICFCLLFMCCPYFFLSRFLGLNDEWTLCACNVCMHKTYYILYTYYFISSLLWRSVRGKKWTSYTSYTIITTPLWYTSSCIKHDDAQ